MNILNFDELMMGMVVAYIMFVVIHVALSTSELPFSAFLFQDFPIFTYTHKKVPTSTKLINTVKKRRKI